MKATAACMLILVPLLGCGSDGGQPTETPTAQTGTVAGQVSDGGGVASVQVNATRSGLTTRTATTGSDGRFTLANMEPGAWQVGLTVPSTHEADPSHGLPVTANVTAGQTTNVTLLLRRRLLPGTIGGSVRTSTGGVPGASLQLTGPAPARQATTSATGAYAFDNVATGVYTVTLTVPAGLQLATNEQAAKQVTLAAGASATADFNLTTPGSGPVREITLANFTFSPQAVTISAGTRVQWTNPTNMLHTVTPDGHTEWSNTSIPEGGTFEHVFNTPGTYNYFCEPHRGLGMTGVIHVQ